MESYSLVMERSMILKTRSPWMDLVKATGLLETHGDLNGVKMGSSSCVQMVLAPRILSLVRVK